MMLHAERSRRVQPMPPFEMEKATAVPRLPAMRIGSPPADQACGEATCFKVRLCEIRDLELLERSVAAAPPQCTKRAATSQDSPSELELPLRSQIGRRRPGPAPSLAEGAPALSARAPARAAPCRAAAGPPAAAAPAHAQPGAWQPVRRTGAGGTGAEPAARRAAPEGRAEKPSA